MSSRGCWLHRLCTSTHNRVKILVNGQAELVKGQAHLWVKGQDMSIVHACECLGVGFVGVVKFKHISGGGVNGRGQNLVKSGLGQGSRLKVNAANIPLCHCGGEP